MNIQQRRGGFYWKESTPYLSVTTALQVIDKPALRYWYGQEVYRAMLVDPTLNENDALSAPYRSGEKAKDRGTTVHSIVEAYKRTGERIEDISENFKGYAAAFYDFMRDFNADLIEQEKTLISQEYKIAGTLDVYVDIGGVRYIIDIKTGKDIYQEAGIQLSAYAQMMRDNDKKVDGIAVLLLETGADKLPTGKYKFQTMTEDFDAFLAAKKLYCYLNREKLLKIGYEG
jgi:hypothetical protein